MRGTVGTAVSVNHPVDKLHGTPKTVRVFWDYVLYDRDESDDSIYTHVEDDDVPLTQVEFVGVVLKDGNNA
jgi:hypothetical protein